VLGSFSFHPDKSFEAHLELNAFEWFAAFDVSGVYTVQAEPFGGYGGEIVILNDDGTVHLRFRFLLASKDEMNFITSYIVEPPPETDPDPPPLDPEKMLQTVAGTMRRTAWH
jgi:hypothetical protein